MIKTKLTLVALLLFIVEITAQTKVCVPDTSFRKALINHSPTYNIIQGNSDTVVVPNINLIDTLIINNKQITNLQGIEKFTALQYLSCAFNQLTTLDVSNNLALTYLNCFYNTNLSILNVSNNTALQVLDCSNNKVTTLDVSANTALTHLDCASMNITTLDVSNNTALQTLYCSNNNISTLDVSTNTALQTLSCSNNNISTLDVSNNTALISLSCVNNNLTTLNLNRNTTLTYLKCFGNNLSILDISANTALTDVDCSLNPNLTTIYVWILPFPPPGVIEVKDMSANYVTPPVPAMPILLSPINNATNQSLYPTLKWGKVSFAHTYQLEVSHNNIIVFKDTTLVDTTKKIGPLLYNTIYTWQVRARNVKGTSPYRINQFTTLSAPTSNYSSTTIDFGNVGIGSNKDMSFAVQCMGGDTLKINTINIANSKFMVVGSSQYNIPFTQTSNITIKFTPNGLGKDSTQIILTSNTTKGLDTLKAYGTGTLPTTSIHPEKNFVPTEYSISQNYPNPFNPSTLINYQLPISSYVTLKVYDMLGKEVATLVNGEKKVGVYEVNFDGSQLSGGIYFYRLTAGKFSEIKKMVLVK